MKIGKNLRNLLMRSPATVMLSKTRAVYFGEEYTFEQVTQAEIIEYSMDLLKIVDKKSWATQILKRLGIMK